MFASRGPAVNVVVVVVDNIVVGRVINDEVAPGATIVVLTMVGISPPPICEEQCDISHPQIKIIDGIGIKRWVRSMLSQNKTGIIEYESSVKLI